MKQGKCTFKRQTPFVSSHTFIFSNRPAYRISRHLAFWIFWLLFMHITYWYPAFSRVFAPFYSDWNLEELVKRINAKGGWFENLTVGFRNSWYKGFLGQIALTYCILYFSLPRYLSTKKSKSLTIVITLGLVSAYLIYQYIQIRSNYMGGVRRGDRPYMPDSYYMLAVMTKNIAYSLPMIAGLALAIKVLKRWWQKQQETEQVAREKAKAELQLLKAQIHPHFLFNTLNNIYFFTLSASQLASEMILKLSGMLHYILNECNQSLVPLEKEIKMIKDYLALEKIRYGDQMEMILEIQGDQKGKLIAPLMLIPFIENSFKHGASKILIHPYVKIRICIEETDLRFLISNNKPSLNTATQANGTIGLKNVRKRLQLLYPGTHELNIVNEPESFTVFMKIRLQQLKEVKTTNREIGIYEMA